MEAAPLLRLLPPLGLAIAIVFSHSSASLAQGGDPLSVLGKAVGSDEAKALLGAFDERCSTMDRANLYQCPRDGLAFTVRVAKNGGRVIQQVLIKVTPDGSMDEGYLRPLPFGLALEDRRGDVRAKLGRPDATQDNNDYYERNPRISIDYVPETGNFPGLISQIRLYRR